MRASAWLLLAAACGACGRCSSDPEDTASPRLGRALAAGVTQAVAASGALREPFRCAEPDPLVPLLPADPSFAGAAAGRPLTIDRDVLRIGPRARRTDRTLVVGVVADARGARQETLAQLGVARTAFSEEKVELVVSLGGMGTSEEEIAAVLGALIAEAPWVLWALPGDRESIPAHRAAVAGLHAAGLPVFDGSRIRLVEMDGVLLAAYPGVEHAGQLVAGADGCVHRPDDAAALAARLAGHDGPRVWAGHAPPRQRGPRASDLALGGVHIGERSLAGALPGARAHLVLHGLVDQAALGAGRGQERLLDGAAPVVLGAGPIEAAPVPGPGGPALGGAALVVRVAERTVSWERVRMPLSGSRPPR